MRFPTAIVAATTMFALTLVNPVSADYANPALYTAFDNHLLSDPTEGIFALAGQPSALAGCSAVERQVYGVSTQGNPAGQAVKSLGGCLSLPVKTQSSAALLVNGTWTGCHPPQNFTGCKPYHANIAALGGADDLLSNVFNAQVCFYDASYTVLRCDQGFTNDDGRHGNLDDSITQIAAQYNATQACIVVHQYVPNGSAYLDIEAPPASANVMSAFWQDPPCLN